MGRLKGPFPLILFSSIHSVLTPGAAHLYPPPSSLLLPFQLPPRKCGPSQLESLKPSKVSEHIQWMAQLKDKFLGGENDL